MIWLILIYGSIAALALGWLWLQHQVSELHDSFISLLHAYIAVKAELEENNGKTK